MNTKVLALLPIASPQVASSPPGGRPQQQVHPRHHGDYAESTERPNAVWPTYLKALSQANKVCLKTVMLLLDKFIS